MLSEVRGKETEIGGVYFAVVIKIARFPAQRGAETEIRGEDSEVGSIDFSIEVGVALQRISNFDGVGRDWGSADIVVAVDRADAVA